MEHARTFAALGAAVALGAGLTAALLDPPAPPVGPDPTAARAAWLERRVVELEAALANRVPAPPSAAYAPTVSQPPAAGRVREAEAPREDGATEEGPREGPTPAATSPASPELVSALEALGAAGHTGLQWRLLARSYLALGRMDDVVRCVRAASPRGAEEYGEWTSLLLELPAELRVAPLEELAALGTDNDELLGDLADAYREQGREVDAARLYLQARRVDPGDSEWRDSLATLSDGVRVAALEEALVTGGADASLLALLGQTYAAGGRADDAARAYHQALAGEFRLEWAQELIALDAARAASELERLAPGAGAPGWLALGLAYGAAGDAEAAAAAYVRSLSAPIPADGEAAASLTTMADTVAQQLLALGPEVAIPRLEQVAGSAQGTAFTWATLASAYLSVERPADAQAALSRALELEPDNRMALLQLLATDPATAEAILQRADALQGDDELWGDLGDAYRARERRDDARRCYQRARSLDPNDSEWVQSLAGLGG